MIKHLMGSKSEKFDLEELLHEGRIITDPEEIHKIVTSYFHEWFELDKNGHAGGMASEGALHSDLAESEDDFVMRYAGTGIATDVVRQLWTALQPKISDDTESVRIFQQEIRMTPTIQEFQAAIKATPRNTSGGMSNLTYDMIRCWNEGQVAAQRILCHQKNPGLLEMEMASPDS
jgi:hypothetical protein